MTATKVDDTAAPLGPESLTWKYFGDLRTGMLGIWIGVTFDTLARWPGQEYLCMSRIFAAYSAGGLIGPTLGAIGAGLIIASKTRAAERAKTEETAPPPAGRSRARATSARASRSPSAGTSCDHLQELHDALVEAALGLVPHRLGDDALVLLQRQPQGEGAAATPAGFITDRASVPLGNASRQGQSQAGPLDAAGQ